MTATPREGGPTGVDRLAAGAVIAMAVVGTIIGTATSTLYPQLADRTSSLFGLSGAVLTAAHVVLLLGVIGLARTNAAGRGWLAQVAYAVLLIGLAAQAIAEGLLRFNFDAGTAIFGIASPAMALGFVLLGIAVVRAHAWSGWHRFTPLLCGLYVPIVLIPAFIASGGVSFPVITGWQLCFLLLGLSMWGEARAAAE
ncbi:MAG: hypothetical protein M3O87_02365 [Candidatus Dormibacteraeota bacterium]|nr:hypothetical protein [Candidatus Dormibacteraeota bacterium]